MFKFIKLSIHNGVLFIKAFDNKIDRSFGDMYKDLYYIITLIAKKKKKKRRGKEELVNRRMFHLSVIRGPLPSQWQTYGGRRS